MGKERYSFNLRLKQSAQHPSTDSSLEASNRRWLFVESMMVNKSQNCNGTWDISTLSDFRSCSVNVYTTSLCGRKQTTQHSTINATLGRYQTPGGYSKLEKAILSSSCLPPVGSIVFYRRAIKLKLKLGMTELFLEIVFLDIGNSASRPAD